MSATITAHTDHSITLEVTIELLPSMLESERSIQVALNETGAPDRIPACVSDLFGGEDILSAGTGRAHRGHLDAVVRSTNCP